MTERHACSAFERWLDDGREGGDHPLEHAAGCARCARLLAADDALGAWLGTAGHAPDGFSDRVMQRIATTAASSRARVPIAPPAMAWWLDALRQPATVFAAACSALLVWRLRSLAAAAPAMSAALAAPFAHALAWTSRAVAEVSPASGGGGMPVLALAIGLLPPLLLGSLAAARWAERWTERVTAR